MTVVATCVRSYSLYSSREPSPIAMALVVDTVIVGPAVTSDAHHSRKGMLDDSRLVMLRSSC